MKPKSPGTILPTPSSLETNERWHASAVRSSAAKAEAHPVLSTASTRIVGGEVRYYVTEVKYAVVSHRSGRVLWFDVRVDGDYAAAA